MSNSSNELTFILGTFKEGPRISRLYFVKKFDNGCYQIMKFRKGLRSDSWFTILLERPTNIGLWKNTTYTFLLGNGVQAVYLLSPVDGEFGNDCASWDELARGMKVPRHVAEEIVRGEYPPTAERLDGVSAVSENLGNSNNSRPQGQNPIVHRNSNKGVPCVTPVKSKAPRWYARNKSR